MRRAQVLAAIMLVASAGCQAPPAPETAESPYRASSTVREVMQSVVAPSAQGLWDSVGRISNAKGTFDLAPKTDADWAAVRRHAVTLVESTNLLLMPGRHVAHVDATTNKVEEADPGAELHPAEIEKRMTANWGTWRAMAYALNDSATNILKAIDRKDVAGLETTGSDLDAVCENCHLAFWYPPKQPK